MADVNVSPYTCHVFVCTNDRKGIRKSCADGNSAAVRTMLKQELNDRGWKGKIRVSLCGCMGLCADGPNLIIYPQKIWLSNVRPEDVPDIVSRLEALAGGQP